MKKLTLAQLNKFSAADSVTDSERFVVVSGEAVVGGGHTENRALKDARDYCSSEGVELGAYEVFEITR